MIKLNISIILICLTSMIQTSFAQEQPELSFEAVEVGKGLYMLQGKGGFTGGNIGLSVGEDGVIMIDDSMPSMLDIMQNAIAEITKEPIDFLINTHVHGDHTGNNETMGKSGVHIVAHENLRRHLLEKGVQTQDGMKPAPKKALPVITFADSISFHLNGEDAYVFHVPNAHTDGDAVIKFNGSNVIHAGDVFFNGMFPYIDLKNGGTVDGYIAAQKKILMHADEQTKIIPGHGVLATKKDLQNAVESLEEAKELVMKAMQNDASLEDVLQANPLAKLGETLSWNFITTEKITTDIYQDLSSQ